MLLLEMKSVILLYGTDSRLALKSSSSHTTNQLLHSPGLPMVNFFLLATKMGMSIAVWKTAHRTDTICTTKKPFERLVSVPVVKRMSRVLMIRHCAYGMCNSDLCAHFQANHNHYHQLLPLLPPLLLLRPFLKTTISHSSALQSGTILSVLSPQAAQITQSNYGTHVSLALASKPSTCTKTKSQACVSTQSALISSSQPARTERFVCGICVSAHSLTSKEAHFLLLQFIQTPLLLLFTLLVYLHHHHLLLLPLYPSIQSHKQTLIPLHLVHSRRTTGTNSKFTQSTSSTPHRSHGTHFPSSSSQMAQTKGRSSTSSHPPARFRSL